MLDAPDSDPRFLRHPKPPETYDDTEEAAAALGLPAFKASVDRIGASNNARQTARKIEYAGEQLQRCWQILHGKGDKLDPALREEFIVSHRNYSDEHQRLFFMHFVEGNYESWKGWVTADGEVFVCCNLSITNASDCIAVFALRIILKLR